MCVVTSRPARPGGDTGGHPWTTPPRTTLAPRPVPPTALLAAAIAGRSRGTLWGPGLVITSVGLAAGLWLADGRAPDSFQFLALAVMALGLGGVLAALLAQVRGFSVSAMSIALPVLLFGAFALMEQQAVEPVAGRTWLYAALLAVWGAYELRPSGRG
ncbi:MAG TPA: hypothetical protein VNU26_10365 [Mycobacteriales bacterium]|nr:hypothetical protein [Mycobacteriales bacterium]